MRRGSAPAEDAENAPRDGDVLPFRRRGSGRRERLNRQGGGRPGESRREIDELRDRVEQLEGRVSRGRRTGRRTDRTDAVPPPVEELAPIPLAVEGPKTLDQLRHLLVQIESKQRDEHTSPAVSADLDAMFDRLGATVLGQTDVTQTRAIADQLDHLDLFEESNASHNPKRREAIAAVKAQLQLYLPLRSVELTTAVERLKGLKAREDLLLESKPLPKFDSALEREINAAYATLEKSAFSCTPSEASAIRAEMKLLFRSEEKRWEFKFGNHRWFTSYSDEEKTSQRLYDSRRTMYHARQRQIQNINAKLDKIIYSTGMFWRMLGRGNEHLAA